MTAKAIRAEIAPGAVFDVTNHYITREDHPCHGTQRRTIVRTNTAAFYVSLDGVPGHTESRVDWPRASQIERDQDGTIRMYGGGAGQKPGELFLTLAPVPGQLRMV